MGRVQVFDGMGQVIEQLFIFPFIFLIHVQNFSPQQKDIHLENIEI